MAPPTDSPDSVPGTAGRGRAPVLLAAAGMTVEFTWAGDRWAHRTIASGGADRGWHSVEGTDAGRVDPRWPASPVLVELSRVMTAAGPAVVGVGLAGRSHFSATFAVEPDGNTLRVEVACRLHEPAGWLGSTYRCGDRLVRIGPEATAGPLPRTVTWTYRVGPAGPEAAAGGVAAEPWA